MTGVCWVQKMDGFIDLPRVNGLRGEGEVRFFGFVFEESDAGGRLTFKGLPRYPPPVAAASYQIAVSLAVISSATVRALVTEI